MSENNDKKQEINKNPEVKSSQEVSDQKAKESSVEDKLKETEDKLLRSLAEIEKDGVPTEERVAEIFDAIIPLFPTPQIITFDLHLEIAFTALLKDPFNPFFKLSRALISRLMTSFAVLI